MPKMTPRWRKAAIVLAVLAFVGGIASPSSAVQGNTGQAFLALLNSVIWFGLIYGLFLLTRATRAVANRLRR